MKGRAGQTLAQRPQKNPCTQSAPSIANQHGPPRRQGGVGPPAACPFRRGSTAQPLSFHVASWRCAESRSQPLPQRFFPLLFVSHRSGLLIDIVLPSPPSIICSLSCWISTCLFHRIVPVFLFSSSFSHLGQLRISLPSSRSCSRTNTYRPLPGQVPRRACAPHSPRWVPASIMLGHA